MIIKLLCDKKYQNPVKSGSERGVNVANFRKCFGCHDAQKRSIVVKFLIFNSTYRIETVDFDKFKETFDSFYKDENGRFFVSSSTFRERVQKNEPILVQIPELDSNTFTRAGQYLIDKSKVICVFDN
jgi:hypothetical protein